MPRKKFKKFVELKTSEFHKSKNPKKSLPELRTVDFREGKAEKNLYEVFLAPTHEYSDNYVEAPDNEQEERLKKHYHDHNEDHNKALRIYTHAIDDVYDNHKLRNEMNDYHASEAVNGHLRSAKIHADSSPDAYKPQVHHLDTATSSHEAPEDFHVYTGLHQAPTPGETHIHHGYISTSTNPSVAHNYARAQNEKYEKGDDHSRHETDHHILKLKIEKGSKHGYYIGNRSHLSNYPEEKEFLVGRGKKIHIDPEPEIHRREKTLNGYFGDSRPRKIIRNVHIWHGKIVDNHE